MPKRLGNGRGELEDFSAQRVPVYPVHPKAES